MFFSIRRHEREKQALTGSKSRLTEALLRHSDQGLFLMDAKGRIVPPVSLALPRLFRRADLTHLGVDKLLAPLVSAQTLSAVRTHMDALLSGTWTDGVPLNVLKDVEVRLSNAEGAADTAHYWFDFDPVELPGEARAWLVRVTDVTLQVETQRELAELSHRLQTQGEVLGAVMQLGAARFGSFVTRADTAMKNIAAVLKKPAREEDAFRSKLDETLAEVGPLRRDAAAFNLAALDRAAHVLEDALHELRARPALSGGDFLPLAVKLDALYDQYDLVKTLTLVANAPRDPQATAAVGAAPAGPKIPPAAGTLANTLQVLTAHIIELDNKQAALETIGLELVPPCYQSVVKNVAIQLIRNAVLHGIETPAQRTAAGKTLHGAMRLEFKLQNDCFELLFEDDGGGIDPARVRATAVELGVITDEAAARMRDREVIKLIFKSRFTTLDDTGTDTPHGCGMSLVRRHVHECGGKIALASLPGHETRFKITLPAEMTRATAQTGSSRADDQPKVA